MKRYLPLIFIGTILFVAGGDKVFPGAIGKFSTQTRTSVNNFLIGSFPVWKPKTNPYQRTERELEETDQKK
ncbi:hypothetical protein A0J48_001665 [Sphaerospermopsis aphanizomenoides BCCUSP55]|uniref:hypothetical protein n=1 Tax=Sphaerospermopsis aphanizomenoides TaxID=459663 RepID=UPI0019076A54|nr:hypothetical protein [Sphaerospermopsis aphanizomenoides]MBK1986270.1 hypothetical protein [Sphaerospermopsis aphanizomenoides BCCUSP55]